MKPPTRRVAAGAPLRASACAALLLAAACAARPPRVGSDPRVELIGAVARLTAPKSTETAPSPYVRELTGRLPVPSDPALAAPLGSAERVRLALSLTPPPELERLDAFDDADLSWAGGREALERRLAGLRAYARDAKFSAAYDASRPLLDADAARLRGRLEAADPARDFADYTGLKGPKRVAVLLSPFADPGPAPGRVDLLDDGTASLSLVVGPTFSTSAPSEYDYWSARLPEALWNESAQLLLEPLASLYAARAAQSSKLAAGEGPRCAEDWPRCVRDEAALAVTLRLVARREGWRAAAAARETIENGRKPSLLLTVFLLGLERDEPAGPDAKVPAAWLADEYPRLLAELPLDDASAAPAPPGLPDAAALPPRKRRRLAAFLKSLARRTSDPRLKALASAAPAWARAGAIARPAPLPDDLRRKGIEEFTAGRAEAALADFRIALSSAPNDAQTLASEAAVLASLGRDEEALAAYDSALTAAESQGAPPELAADLRASREETRKRLGKSKTRLP